MLGRRPVNDPAELGTVVAECLTHLEPGLTLLDRSTAAGDVTVELTAASDGGRLVLILCDLVAGPETVLRAVEAAAWWREHAELAARVFAGAGVDPHAAPRTLVVATRWTDRALRLARALGPVAPVAVECRVFRDADGGSVVSLDRLDVTREGDAALAGAGVAARPDARPEPTPPAVTAPASLAAPAQRAAVLIERLERLRFSEVFR
jgi:hypothetical protein